MATWARNGGEARKSGAGWVADSLAECRGRWLYLGHFYSPNHPPDPRQFFPTLSCLRLSHHVTHFFSCSLAISQTFYSLYSYDTPRTNVFFHRHGNRSYQPFTSPTFLGILLSLLKFRTPQPYRQTYLRLSHHQLLRVQHRLLSRLKTTMVVHTSS